MKLNALLRDPSAVDPRIAYLSAHKQALLPEFRAAGIECTCLTARASWDFRWVLRLRRLLRSERIDLVHSHSPITTIGARLARFTLPRNRRPRLITTEHNVWGSHAWATRMADTATARGDELHIAVSSAVRASMPARLQPETRVIQYGVDIAEIRRATGGREDARRSLSVGEDEVLVGTVANLRATKGYADLLAAARIVADTTENVTFVAVGQGPMENELREMAVSLGLGERFRFLGYRSDVAHVMSAFDVFCLASHYEGLPIALMEALVLGLPVVATDVGGIAEIVSTGCEAILVPPSDPRQLAAALVTLARDPALRVEMAQRARLRGKALDIAQSIRAVEAVYREVLRG